MNLSINWNDPFHTPQKVQRGKVGCVFPVVISSEFHIAQYRDLIKVSPGSASYNFLIGQIKPILKSLAHSFQSNY